ncbi:MAG: hypothetical protein B7Z51_00110, partial [Methyloversatilis sp. 12-65-5]
MLLALALAAPLPVAAGLYDGPVDPAALAAAYDGWRELKDELHLIVPYNGAIYGGGVLFCCGHDSVSYDVYDEIYFWP